MVTYLLIGSNLRDRKQLLHEANHHIEIKVGTILETSSIYETSSWGIQNLPPFLNQVVVVDTDLGPMGLLHMIKEIEMELGRKSRQKWHSREIDIDILFYDNLIVENEFLTVPHPHIQDRLFTLIPLQEVNPNLRHPLTLMSISEMIDHCTDTEKVNLFEEE